MVKKLTMAALGVGVVLLLAWVAGYDFDSRGGTALYVAVNAVCVGAMGWLLGHGDT